MSSPTPPPGGVRAKFFKALDLAGWSWGGLGFDVRCCIFTFLWGSVAGLWGLCCTLTADSYGMTSKRAVSPPPGGKG